MGNRGADAHGGYQLRSAGSAEGEPGAEKAELVSPELPSLYEDIQKIAIVQRKSTSEVVQEMMEEYRKRNIEKLGEYDRLQTEV